MNPAQQAALIIFIVAATLSIGLRSGTDEVQELFRSKKFLGRALVVNFVLVPAAGIAIGVLWPLDQPSALALMLLACAPGGATAMQFTTKLPGQMTMAGALFVLLLLLAVPFTPVLALLIAPSTVDVSIPWGQITVTVFVLVLAPLGAGLLVRRKLPKAAGPLSKLLIVSSFLAFVAFSTSTGSARQEMIAALDTSSVAALLVFFAISLGLGWLLGGPDRHTRHLLATATSMRNVALCLAIVESTAPGSAVTAPLVAFSYLMLVPNILYTVGGIIKGKLDARRAAKEKPA